MRRKGVSFPTASSAASLSELSGLICSRFCFVTLMLVSPEDNRLVPEGIWLHQQRGTSGLGLCFCLVVLVFFYPPLKFLETNVREDLAIEPRSTLCAFFPFLNCYLPFLVYCNHKGRSKHRWSFWNQIYPLVQVVLSS